MPFIVMPHDHLMAYYGNCDRMVIAIHFMEFLPYGMPTKILTRHNKILRVNTRDLTVRYQHLVDQPQEYTQEAMKYYSII